MSNSLMVPGLYLFPHHSIAIHDECPKFCFCNVHSLSQGGLIEQLCTVRNCILYQYLQSIYQQSLMLTLYILCTVTV